jgi:hypothetical protein
VFTILVNHGNCKINNDLVEGAIGMITTTDDYNYGDIITVFDETKKHFSDISLTEEYQVFAVKCLSADDTYYKIIQNNGKIGFIKKNHKKLQFQTWEEHILGLPFVGFDQDKNPLMQETKPGSIKIRKDIDVLYQPSKIHGDWLQVKWGDEKKWNYGWIKWKHNSKLLIELFYFA